MPVDRMAQNVTDSSVHAGTTPPSVNTYLAAGVAVGVGLTIVGEGEEAGTRVGIVT